MPTQYIAQNQTALLSILISPDAPPYEVYAARELKHYLDLMACCAIPIVHEKDGPCIAIGQGAPALGHDGFHIHRQGDSLSITGGERGVIYGVYELLEHMGCRFFTPLCEKVPSIVDLILPDLDTPQIPVLEYRQHNYKDFTQYPRFAVKRRMNAGDLDELYGGGMSYVWFVHTFEDCILNPEEMYDEHPEYFSMVDGVRLKHRAQLCLTNPEVLSIAIEKVKAALRANPAGRIISVSQNDWFNQCQCPACAKVDAEEESAMGTLLRFVNAIAEAIEPEFPEVIVDTLAYNYSRPAPKLVRPRHNVCVRLCSIEACFAHPFETCDDETRYVKRPDGSETGFIADLESWGKICNRLYIWDYTTCFAHYPAPYPNWNVLQPNMRAFVRNGVKGVFEQACGALGGSTDLNELRAYLISKLLWDAECDLEYHMNDFLSHFYGAGAPYIREYIRTLTAFVERENVHIGFNDQCDKPYLTPEKLDEYDALFDQACAALQGDAIRLMHVEKARLSIRWVRLKNRAMLEHKLIPGEINQFFEDWRAHGLTRIDEWVSAEMTHRALIEGLWRGTEFLEDWRDDGKERL